MRYRSAICRFLAALAVLGLLVAPFARPVMAAAMQTTGEPAAMDMPADMPCCPDQMPAKDCAKDCPLMATCMAGSVQDMPPVAALFILPRTTQIVLPAGDADATGLGTGPPQRPPKT